MAGPWAVLPALLLLGQIDAANQPEPGFQHVRSTDAGLLGVVREAYQRSETVKALINRIERSDVIVYIEPGHCAFGHVDACVLPFMNRAGGSRYMRIVVSTSLVKERLLAVMAHELQHAREVADSPAVIDADSMRALYRRIGVQFCGETNADCYETAQAQAAGRAAYDELTRKR